MLKKLLIWDLRATWKKFCIVLAAFALLCIGVPGALLAADPKAALTWTIFTFALGYTAVYVIVLIFILLYYNSSLYGDEGYLTFTLPLEGWRLLLSKVLMSLLWGLATLVLIGFAVLLSLHIFFLSPEMRRAAEVLNLTRLGSANCLAVVLLCLLGAVDQMLIIFFSITLSKLPLWRKWGVGAGIAAFIVIYIVQSLPALFWQGEISLFIGNTASAARRLDLNVIYSWRGEWPSMIVYILVSAVAFWATAHMLEKSTCLK